MKQLSKILIVWFCFFPFVVSAQFSQQNAAIVSGGGNASVGNYSASVTVGQTFANSHFSKGKYSGNIGFLKEKASKYQISVSVNPENGATVSGAGNYLKDKQVNLIATMQTGYEFINWTENGTEVSTNPNYSFAAIKNRNLVANLKKITSNFKLKIGNKIACVNEDNIVTITSEGINNIGSFSAIIKYDPTKAKFKKAESSILIDIMYHEPILGEIRLSWINFGDNFNISDGELLDLIFEFKEGVTDLTFDLNKCEIADYLGNTINIEYTNGSLQQGKTPEITQHPKSQEVCETENVVLTSAANNADKVILLEKKENQTWQSIFEQDNPQGEITYSLTADLELNNAEYKFIFLSDCKDTSDIVTITVHEKPTVTLANFETVYTNTPAFALTGGLPENGTYSGTGVENNTFNPELAGVGDHIITYKYTNANSCSDSKTSVITVLKALKIKGYISYHNTKGTKLENATVKLLSNNTEIASTTTDENGYYEIEALKGNYKLEISTNETYGGINTADCYLIQRVYIGIHTFDILQTLAGDVNMSKTINSLDAFLVNKRFLKKIDAFKQKDWVFEEKEIFLEKEDIQVDIKGLCAGDVNGSKYDNNGKSSIELYSTKLKQETSKSKLPLNESFTISILAENAISTNAQAVVLNCPEGLEIESINSKSPNFSFNKIGNELRIGQYSLETQKFAENEAIFSMTVRRTKDTPFIFTLENETEFTNLEGSAINNVTLVLPTEQNMSVCNISTLNNVSLYPNPSNGLFTIEMNNQEKGKVLLQVFNQLGKSIKTIELEKTSDYLKTEVDLQNVSKGLYYLQIKINDKQENKKVVITK